MIACSRIQRSPSPSGGDPSSSSSTSGSGSAGDELATKLPAADQEALNAPLSSILVRDKVIFAVNEKGMFRATKKDKQWVCLPLPQQVRLKGSFGRTSGRSDHLLYFAGHALYDSTDGGITWHLISEDQGFQNVLLHHDGSLYAIIVRSQTMIP